MAKEILSKIYRTIIKYIQFKLWPFQTVVFSEFCF